MAELTARLIGAAALVICVHGVFSSFLYGVRTEGLAGKLGLLALALTLLGLMYAGRHLIRRTVSAVPQALTRLSPATFWAIALGLGIGLRTLWWHWVPFSLIGGDPLNNWRLALSLLDHGSYEAETSFGTWRGLYPPGLPFALVPFMAIFGRGAYAVLALNLAFFLIALAFLYLTCRRLMDEGHARWAALMLAVLPNLLMYASQPYKEPLLVSEICLFVYALCRAGAGAGRAQQFGWSFGAGLTFGLIVLTQSSLAPVLGLAVIVLALEGARPGRAVRIAVLILGTVLTIAPWSARQSLTFGKFVPLTTGSGWSFYTGNNPIGLGGFTPYEDFFPDLLTIDERDLSAVSFKRGLAYVKANPARFAELAVRREMLVTCCMNHAVSDTMLPAGYGEATINAWKVIACACWLALLTLLLVNGRSLLAAAVRQPVVTIALGFPVVTLLVHTIMEAGSRHMSMNAGVWIFAAVAAMHAGQRRAARAPVLRESAS